MQELTITVCADCLTASCWLGMDECDQSIFLGAWAPSSVEKTRAELEVLDLEDSSYWDD